MTLAERILEYDRARAAGGDAPVPATGGRRVVCVVCPELLRAAPGPAARLGLDAADVEIVAVPGARVMRADGDVARAVALAAAACGGSMGGGDVILLAGEGSPYRSPSFGVPGPAPQGESFPTTGDLLRHSVTQLRASPWLARVTVDAFVVTTSGRLEPVRSIPAATAGAAAAQGWSSGPAPSLGAAPGPASFGGAGAAIAASGPVSFFGGSGAAGPSLASPPPIQAGPVRWDAPPPIAAGAPLPPSPIGVGSGARVAAGARVASGAEMPSIGAMPVSQPMPSGGFQMPTVGPLPQVTAPIPTVEMPSAPVVSPPSPVLLDAPPAPPAPPPAPRTGPKPHAAPEPQRRRESPPPPPPPPSASGDDPFKRAEEILERLRRERRR